MIKSFELTAREKNIQLEMETAPAGGQIPFNVNADESAMQQVFTNLIGNAIKFSRPYGKVIVKVSVLNSDVQISVIDTGIGILSEDIPMLFNRFFRGSNAVLEEIQGTGIGLFIVRTILDKHAGKILVNSEQGKGSQFDVLLPLAEQ